jgi:AcrR family transcriptional regulator
VSDINGQKKKILETSMNLFASRGFEGTSIREISRAMNMSISGIYYYFGSKEGLVEAIIESNSQRLITELRRIVDAEKEPLARFRKLVETNIRMSGEYPREAKIFFLNEEHLTKEGRKKNRQVQREILEMYINELGALQAGGYLECRNITVMAFNVLSVVLGFPRWYLPDGKLSLEEVVQELIGFIMQGVLGMKAPVSKQDSRAHKQKRVRKSTG